MQSHPNESCRPLRLRHTTHPRKERGANSTYLQSFPPPRYVRDGPSTLGHRRASWSKLQQDTAHNRWVSNPSYRSVDSILTVVSRARVRGPMALCRLSAVASVSESLAAVTDS